MTTPWKTWVKNIETSTTDAQNRKLVFSNQFIKRDDAIIHALEKAQSATEVAVLATVRSYRFEYFLEPIVPMNSFPLGFQFDRGTWGWWFFYSIDSTAQNGLQLIVMRTPTKLQKNDAQSTIFTVCGYLLISGKIYSFNSRPGQLPAVAASVQSYSVTKDGLPELKLGTIENSTLSNLSVQFSTTDGKPLDPTQLKNVRVSISGDFTKPAADTPTSFQAEFQAAGRTGAKFQGKEGCVPCISGLGTNYFSLPDLRSTLTLDGNKTVAGEMKGWMDHQFWKVSPTPANWFSRVVGNVGALMAPSPVLSWCWFTVQLPEVQYTIYVVGDPAALVPGYTVTLDNIVMFTPTASVYDVVGQVTFVAFSKSGFTKAVKFQVNGRRFLSTTVTDEGLITLPDGNVNQEVAAVITDLDTNTVVGTGFQENNNFFHTYDTPLAIAGIPEESRDLFTQTQLLPHQSEDTVYLVLGVYIFLFVLLLVLVIFAMKAL